MKKITNFLAGLIVIAAMSVSASAKEYEATVLSDPDGAVVYLNGMIVAQTTPAIIRIDSKQEKRI